MEVAEETQRSMSQAFILLLARGIEVYRQDGFLVDTKPKPKLESGEEESPEEPAPNDQPGTAAPAAGEKPESAPPPAQEPKP